MSGKNIFTIPPHVSFLDALAEGLWERAGRDAVQLAAMRVFLPTRRACRLLREAFLKLNEGRAILLPRMQPIGDIDEEELLFADAAIEAEIPPAIAPMRRRLLLAELIRKRDTSMPVDQAVHLAEALARFLDEAQIKRCDFGKLKALVQQRELAAHWEEIVKFLDILTEAWPTILAAEGCIDPAIRRDRVLAAQAEAWRKHPPATPIIAAGSTGSMPATADFLTMIATLPQGSVILPGLDTRMDETAWQAIGSMHPQHGMKELLTTMKAGAQGCGAVAGFLRYRAAAFAPVARSDASGIRHRRMAATSGKHYSARSVARFFAYRIRACAGRSARHRLDATAGLAGASSTCGFGNARQDAGRTRCNDAGALGD